MKYVRHLVLILPAMVSCLANAADQSASATTAAPGDQSQTQIVVPEVTRRDVPLPHFPSNDFQLGLLGGEYATQNFGTAAAAGLRLGYDITEDFFVQSVLGETKVSDKNYRQILPGGVFPKEKETLSYYNLSVGYNILPGEVFVGSHYAFPFMVYLIGGVGNTTLDSQKHATFNFGAGMRWLLTDTWSVQLDARDHIFSLDLLGQRERTQNLEFTVGLTASF